MTKSASSSLEMTNNILDFINVGICIVDEEYRIVKMNEHLSGLLQNKACPDGKTCYNYIRKQEKACQFCPLHLSFKTGDEHVDTLNNPFNEKENKWYELHTHPIKIDGEIKQVMLTYRDVTKRKNAEDKLLKRNDGYKVLLRQTKEYSNQLKENGIRYKALYENAPIPYQSLDQNAKILDVNPAWCKTLGYNKAEVIGRYFGNFIHQDEQKKIKEQFSIFKNEGKICDVRFRMKHKDGKYISVSYEGTVAYDSNGKFKQTYCTFKDITEQEQHEETLRVKNQEYEKLNQELIDTNKKLTRAKNKAIESNHLKSEFLHNMSHEIRTPMNGIIGFADMIQDSSISAHKKEFFAKIIKSSSHQLLRIIDDILEISRLETKQIKANKELVNLNDLLLEQFSIFSLKAKERQIPLYIKKGLSDKDSDLLTDRTKLNKIIQNLLENALKFTSDGFIEIGYYISNDKVHIYVKDTGVGISPKNLNAIFERFSQEEKSLSRKQGGLGLGLSISKENAQILGGNITVDSEKGYGATFTIELPYLRPAHVQADIDEKGQIKEKDCFTILIAEDEEINYLFLETVIKEIEGDDLHILHAFNGKEAVNMFKDHKVDLVLMDVKMPVMDGHQATKLIKDINPKIPVIAQTAYATDYDRERSKGIGYDLYLTKPISQKTLIELIEEHIKLYNNKKALSQTL